MKKPFRVSCQLKRALALGMLLLTCACVTEPGSTKYFEHDMTVISGGHRYDFKRYFTFSKTLELSEGDGKLHARWNKSGVGFTTVQIGNGRVLVYSITGDCESDQQEWPAPQPLKLDLFSPYMPRVLDSAESPKRLILLTGKTDGFPVTIENESTREVDRIEGLIGPSKEDLSLKETVRNSQHGFQRVTVQVIPFEVWGATDSARRYFSQFKNVTVAEVGESPPRNGWPDSAVRFRFSGERNYKRGVHGEIVGLDEIGTVYNGEAFAVDSSPSSGLQTWYATKETLADPKLNDAPVAVVNYKGVVFEVKNLQEIYDPATRNILLFQNWHAPYPWGGPEPADVERLTSGR
jgi:hypothetical protein